MKLTNKEIVDVANGMRALIGVFLNKGMMSEAVKYGLTARYLETFAGEVDIARNTLIKKHAREGTALEVGTDEHAAFMEEWREYLGCKVDVDMDCVHIQNDILAAVGTDIFLSILPILDWCEK